MFHNTMLQKLKYALWPEDHHFVAQCLDVDVASDGETPDEAISNLEDALRLYFDGTTPFSSTDNPPGLVFGELELNA